MQYGLNVKDDRSGKRLEFQCPHQNGLLYVIPSKASWVCSEDNIHAHAIAGFFGDLSSLDYPKIEELMQKWGLYFRKRSLEEDQ